MCICVCVCVCVCVCLCICHIFFIHSSVDAHLGCFHILVTVNSATMNIRVLRLIHVNIRFVVSVLCILGEAAIGK